MPCCHRHIHDSDLRFAEHRIFCVGRNYAATIRSDRGYSLSRPRSFDIGKRDSGVPTGSLLTSPAGDPILQPRQIGRTAAVAPGASAPVGDTKKCREASRCPCGQWLIRRAIRAPGRAERWQSPVRCAGVQIRDGDPD